MKRTSRGLSILLAFAIVLLAISISSADVRCEASGMAYAPANTTGAQAMLLARRGAILDLYRNLLGHDAAGTGFISGVRVISERWDGKVYTVRGFIDKAEEVSYAGAD